MPSLQRIISIALIAGQLSACTTWRTETVSPADVLRVYRPAKVRVEHLDGHLEVLYDPEVRKDTVVGRRAAYDPTPNRALSFTQIKQVATRDVSTGRTVGFVLGLGLIAALVARSIRFQALGNLGY